MAGGIKKIIRIVAIVIAVLVVASYSYFQTKDLIAGPLVTILSPQNGSLLDESLIEISGVAQNISEIKMNGREIHVDEKGNFAEKVLLSYGYNVVEVSVSDKFNRKLTKRLEVVYK